MDNQQVVLPEGILSNLKVYPGQPGLFVLRLANINPSEELANKVRMLGEALREAFAPAEVHLFILSMDETLEDMDENAMAAGGWVRALN